MYFMTKEDLIQLTNNLYRLTSLFPKKEPLRFKTRELSNDILANFLRIARCSHTANQREYTNTKNPSKTIENSSLQTLEDLEILDSFFEVAKNQNWVSAAEILKVQQEYRNIGDKLKEELKKLSEVKNLPEDRPQKDSYIVKENYNTVPDYQTPARQGKILLILKEKEKLQVKDLKEVFPEVSKRTLRRDFEQLLKKGLVVRLGEKNNTSYQIS